MSTEAWTRIETQRREDLRRLADQAERRGVRILHTRDGAHFATSATDATLLYPVGVESGCTCLAAVHGGLCGHLGLLLSELGLIPETAEERSAALAQDACDEAEGEYEAAVHGVIVSGRGWPAAPADTRRQIAA